jgi:hypothetical protein
MNKYKSILVIVSVFMFSNIIHTKAESNDWITFDMGVTEIISIENNKICRKWFHFDFSPYENLNDTITFSSKQILQKNLSVNKDKLTVKYIQNEGKANVKITTQEYKKLEQYNQAKFKKELKKLLAEYKYNVKIFHDESKNIEMDFLEQGVFVTQNLKRQFSINQFWEIDIYKNELFLVFDSGTVFQIKNINNNEIVAVLCNKTSDFVLFSKVIVSSKFNPLLLNGTWTEVKVIDKDAPQPPPMPEGYRTEEILVIESEFITRKYENKEVKLKWLTNKSSDRILFLEKWDNSNECQWKIKKIN